MKLTQGKYIAIGMFVAFLATIVILRLDSYDDFIIASSAWLGGFIMGMLNHKFISDIHSEASRPK